MSTKTVAVLNESDLADGQMKQVEFGDGQVLVSRLGDEVHATSAFCTHYGAPLAKGVLTADGRVVCPWHGACFSVCTGDIEDAPAPMALHSFKAHIADGKIYVTANPSHTLKENMSRQPRLLASYADSSDKGVLIIGGGSATFHVIESLREHGYKGAISVISKETYAPIDRTKLSKALITDPAKIEWRNAADLKIKYGATLRTGVSVSSVDLINRKVKLEGTANEEIGYQKLILASGGTPRVLPIEGAKLKNVFTFRGIEDAKTVDAAAKEGKKMVVIGSSFIGMELVVAVAKRKLASIDVVGMEEYPFESVLGKEVGKGLKDYHESQGVKFHMSSQVDKIVPSDSDAESAGGVVVNGQTIPADFVIMAVGVAPATEYLKDSGIKLEKDGGIKVNEYLQVQELPDGVEGVYAVGDIAHFPQIGGASHTRIEHWNVAGNHGRAVGKTIAGSPQPFVKVPVFWSAQGQQLRYCGVGQGYDEVIVKGNTSEMKFIAYYVKEGKIVAVSSMQNDPVVSKASELLRLGLMPSAEEVRAGKSLLEVDISTTAAIGRDQDFIKLAGTLSESQKDDIKTLQALNKRLRRTPTNEKLYRESLTGISHHLRLLPSQHPSTQAGKLDRYRPATRPETLAVIAIDTLHAGYQEGRMGQETKRALHDLMKARWSNILRWMDHLYAAWVYDFEPEDAGSGDGSRNSHPNDAAMTNANYGLTPSEAEKRLVDAVPGVLRIMVEYQDILDLMKTHSHIGPLLVRIAISNTRVCNIYRLSSYKATRYALLRSGGHTKRWESDFIRTVKQSKAACASIITDRVKECATAPLKFADEITYVIAVYFDCASSCNDMLDECLEQGGVIRALTLIFERSIRGIETRRLPLHRNGRDVFFDLSSMVVVLGLSFRRGGAPLIATAFREGLLDGIMGLRRLCAPGGLANLTISTFENIDTSIFKLLETIQPFIVYPCVLKAVLWGLDRHQEEIPEDPRNPLSPSQLKRVDFVLEELNRRLHDEVAIWNKHRTVTQQTSSYSNPYKFCDNIDVRSIQSKALSCFSHLDQKSPHDSAWCFQGRSLGSVVAHSASRATIVLVTARKSCGNEATDKNARRSLRATEASTREGFPPVTTDHDREYFRRTVVSRYHYWVEKLSIQGVNDGSIVSMDFRKEPIKVECRDRTQVELRRLQVGAVPRGPMINAMFPTCKKRGIDLSVTAFAVPRSQGAPATMIQPAT